MDTLLEGLTLADPEAARIVAFYRTAETPELVREADRVCRSVHGDGVWIRGLVEFDNYCDRGCAYCGIRKDNANVRRYRLEPAQVVDTVREGWNAGLKSFVLQGGEDPAYSVDMFREILHGIFSFAPEAAVVLSVGIRAKRDYKALREAGASRYLLRFETSDPALHRSLRGGIPLSRRLRALEDLREAGFEVGSGYMVGLPGETEEIRIANALLCRKLELDMVGIGPFIPHPDTPLGNSPQEPIELAVRATALVRLLLPQANIPATTAAGSLHKAGREKLMAAGANVLMPNLTPGTVRKDYLLYPGKICLDESGLDCLRCLDVRTGLVNKVARTGRGDSPSWTTRQTRGEPANSFRENPS